MNSPAAILAAIALAVPVGPLDIGTPDSRAVPDDLIASAAPEHEQLPMGLQPRENMPSTLLDQAHRTPIQNQMRIEQRVIIRISPPSRRVREQLMADAPAPPDEQVFKEGKQERCVRMSDIMGVQPSSDNRLLLFMRGQRVLTAKLDRSCSSQDFYSGFYVERSEDGRLCQRRERLQSRAGAVCEISRINRLEARGD